MDPIKWNGRRLLTQDYNNFTGFTERNQNLDYSQVNTSYYHSNPFTCESHQGEPITNYCSALECLSPLCPVFKFYIKSRVEITP